MILFNERKKAFKTDFALFVKVAATFLNHKLTVFLMTSFTCHIHTWLLPEDKKKPNKKKTVCNALQVSLAQVNVRFQGHDSTMRMGWKAKMTP